MRHIKLLQISLLVIILSRKVYGHTEDQNTRLGDARRITSDEPEQIERKYPTYLSEFFVVVSATEHALCGGSIISHHVILTAAYCFKNYTTTDGMFIYKGRQYMPFRNKTAIRTVIIHPDYKEDADGWSDNNIAVVFVEKSFPKFINWLGWKSPCPNEWIKVAGNGLMLYERPNENPGFIISPWVLRTHVQILDLATCAYILKHPMVAKHQMCTLGNRTGTCEGDWGGPIYDEINARGDHALYGIIGFGKGCGDPSQPWVHTRIWSYERWIYSTILRNFTISGVYRSFI